MRFNGIVKFISHAITYDAMNRPQATETTGADVPCIVESVGVIENYQAMAAGFKPDVRIKVRANEYIGQPHFLYASERYKVIRASSADMGFTVIVGEAINRG